MNVLITYDISTRQPEVKNAMEALGYYDRWGGNNLVYNLPYSTLWKKNIELSAALKEMNDAIIKLNIGRSGNDVIKLERCIVVAANPWDGIPGDPHLA